MVYKPRSAWYNIRIIRERWASQEPAAYLERSYHNASETPRDFPECSGYHHLWHSALHLLHFEAHIRMAELHATVLVDGKAPQLHQQCQEYQWLLDHGGWLNHYDARCRSYVLVVPSPLLIIIRPICIKIQNLHRLLWDHSGRCIFLLQLSTTSPSWAASRCRGYEIAPLLWYSAPPRPGTHWKSRTNGCTSAWPAINP